MIPGWSIPRMPFHVATDARLPWALHWAASKRQIQCSLNIASSNRGSSTLGRGAAIVKLTMVDQLQVSVKYLEIEYADEIDL